MKKTSGLLLSIMSIIFLGGCGSSHGPFNYNINPTPIVKGETKYVVKNVSVKLEQKYQVSGYPSEKELGVLFKEKLEAKLKSKNLLATENQDNNIPMDIDLQISYKRVFMGEAFGKTKAVARMIISFDLNIKNGDQLVASYSRNNITTNYGLIGNLGTIFKQISCSTKPKDEEKDINTFVNSFADEIEDLGKK